ncbi:MAG: hypothetical protein H6700_10655 [Myxococcales bacterium]|nr:hypothetical protein [Myxococcales bacterium]
MNESLTCALPPSSNSRPYAIPGMPTSSFSQTTVPSEAIERIEDPAAQVPATRVWSVDVLTEKVVPLRVRPVPAV